MITITPSSPIYLLGFMGSGKSYVGQKLANVLGYQFIDLDEAIVEAAGKSITEIFAEVGEAGFRVLERECLHQTLHLSQSIVAVGGGTPCFFDNMMQMNAHGYTIYLKMPIDVLAFRLEKGKEKRPLIANMTAVELRKFITQKIEERGFFYEKAKYVYEMGTNERAVVGDIAQVLSR